MFGFEIHLIILQVRKTPFFPSRTDNCWSSSRHYLRSLDSFLELKLFL